MSTVVAPPTTFPVLEIFGPTIQGEGPVAGLPCYFIRVAGCDYRCSWCDSMYAVDPKEWTKTAERLSAMEIVERLGALPTGPGWVTISGGNPALYDLAELVGILHAQEMRVSLETQGTRWRDWMMWIDSLVLSPKPPSSGWCHHDRWERFRDLVVRARRTGDQGIAATAVKVVVFDDADYEYACRVFEGIPSSWARFISVGTLDPLAGLSAGEYREQICDAYARLAERVSHDPVMQDARVLPQLHVLAWGEARGV